MTNRNFQLGPTFVTLGVIHRIHPDDVTSSLLRHANCDWGDLCAEDKAENEQALKKGFRLFSAYHDRHGAKFWIITEADRSATTILLPEEY